MWWIAVVPAVEMADGNQPSSDSQASEVSHAALDDIQVTSLV